MADADFVDGPSAADWMFEQIAGEDPAPTVWAARNTGDGGDQSSSRLDNRDGRDETDEPRVPRGDGLGDQCPHDLDNSVDDTRVGPGDLLDAGAKRAAVWLGSAVVVTAVVIVLMFAVFGTRQDPVPPPVHRAPRPTMAAAPTTATLAAPQQDRAVSFTAQTDSCTPAGGSSDQSANRSPQALTDTGADSAWVCGRGPQESLVDGQILHIQFTCDAGRSASTCSYIINALSVTPGWVGKTAAGNGDWLGHRVVRRLQFNFFSGSQLAADPFFLDTQDVHGPVTAALPGHILASRVEVIVLHTERPPADPLPSSPVPAAGSAAMTPPDTAVYPIPGPGPTDPITSPPVEPAAGVVGSDPVDATFAMSQMQFFGHAPH